MSVKDRFACLALDFAAPHELAVTALNVPHLEHIAKHHVMKQETQPSLTNLREAFIGQSRSPNIVPFHMLEIVSYCAIVTLFLR